jgi:hypothetical protein
MLESKPDALPDDVRARLEWADKAEQMLHDILSALGYRARVTPAELLAAIVVWLESVRRMRVDPAGNIATFWARAFDRAFHQSPMATTKAATEEATEAADFAVDEFARRFPPLLEDASDDLEALREELASYRAEVEAYEEAEREAKGVFEALGLGTNQSVADCARYYADYHARQMRAADEIKASIVARAEKAEAELTKARAEFAGEPHGFIVTKTKPEHIDPAVGIRDDRWQARRDRC